MGSLTPRPPEWTDTAPVKVAAARELWATPDEVFEALADHESWPDWFDGVTRVERLGHQHGGVGSRRRVIIGGRGRVDEEFNVWEPGTAWGFTGTDMSPPLLRSLNERVTIQPIGPDRVRVTYLMAIDPRPVVGLVVKVATKRIAKNLAAALESLGRRLEAQRAG